MKKYGWLLLFALLIFAALIVYNATRSIPSKPDEAGVVRQTVTDFYTALIPADPRGAPTGFRPEESELVSAALKEKIMAANRASEMGIGFDPFLCAQAFPSRWSVGEVTTEGERAHAVLESYFGNSANPVIVTLVKNGDVWQIDATNCFPP